MVCNFIKKGRVYFQNHFDSLSTFSIIFLVRETLDCLSYFPTLNKDKDFQLLFLPSTISEEIQCISSNIDTKAFCPLIPDGQGVMELWLGLQLVSLLIAKINAAAFIC